MSQTDLPDDAQPIATAPHTRLLLLVDETWVVGDWWEDEDWAGWLTRSSEPGVWQEIEPTHWRPIPEPSKVQP